MKDARHRYTSQSTCYDKVRFRSRLEARWAAFFNALDIQYCYEPVVPRVSYRPDFWLPSLQAFIEIKPSREKIHAGLEANVKQVAKLTRKRVYLFFGEVVPLNDTLGHGNAWVIYPPNRDRTNVIETHYHWCECPMCHKVTIARYGDLLNRLRCSCDLAMYQPTLFKSAFHSRRLMWAYRQAEASIPSTCSAEQSDDSSWGSDDLLEDDEYDLQENPSIWELAPEMELDWDDWEPNSKER